MADGNKPPRVAIRSACADDVPLILALVRELAEYERLEHTAVSTDSLLREQLFGERPAAEAIIAELDGEPAGFAVYFQNFSTFLGRHGMYLEDLFVRPRFRGHGAGKALLRHIAKLAQQRGCGRMEWSVLDWNKPAIGFYEGLGATPMSEWTTYRLAGDALAALATS